MTACDRLVLASPAWVDRLASRYGDALRAKCVVITNGFDPDLDQNCSGDEFCWPESAKLRIAFTGSMFASESPAPLVDALISLLKSDADLLDGVHLVLAGYGGAHELELRARVARANAENTIHFLGTVSHATALMLQRSADVLALSQGIGHKETIQGKLLEYLSAGKPVLALNAPDGIGAKILERAGVGVLVAHGDAKATVDALKRLLKEGAPCLTPDWGYISTFDRRSLASRFAQVLISASRSKQ